MSDVIVIGTFIVDILLKGYKLENIKPDNISFMDSCKMGVGGNGCNVAVDLARLGVRVQVMGNIAQDNWGTFILDEMKRLNIDSRCMQISNDVGTGVSVIFVEENGEKGILQYVGANKNLSFKQEGLDDESGIVVITGLGLIPEIEDNFKQISGYFKHKNKLILVDTSANTGVLIEKMKNNICTDIDYFLVNEREAFDLSECNDIEEAADYLLGLGNKNVIIKLGDRGAYFANKATRFYKQAVETDVVDTTGAGDAFLSGFVYGLIHKMDIEKCVELSNKVGSACVEKVGATTNIRNMGIIGNYKSHKFREREYVESFNT